MVCIAYIDCQICLGLPEHPIVYYQCSEGHLICSSCFQTITFDKKCAVCRKDMKNASRNRIAEECVKIRIVKCENDQCNTELQYGDMYNHIMKECKYTNVACKYKPLGCSWNGMRNNQLSHQSQCRKSLNLDTFLLNKRKSDLLNEMKRYELNKVLLEHDISYSFPFNIANPLGIEERHSFDSFHIEGDVYLKYKRTQSGKKTLMIKIVIYDSYTIKKARIGVICKPLLQRSHSQVFDAFKDNNHIPSGSWQSAWYSIMTYKEQAVGRIALFIDVTSKNLLRPPILHMIRQNDDDFYDDNHDVDDDEDENYDDDENLWSYDDVDNDDGDDGGNDD